MFSGWDSYDQNVANLLMSHPANTEYILFNDVIKFKLDESTAPDAHGHYYKEIENMQLTNSPLDSTDPTTFAEGFIHIKIDLIQNTTFRDFGIRLCLGESLLGRDTVDENQDIRQLCSSTLLFGYQ